MKDLAQKRIEENRRLHAIGDSTCKKLDLGNCNLSEIPDEVFDLVWLEVLILCNAKRGFGYNFDDSEDNTNNTLSYLPAGLLSLENLKMLKVNGYWAGDDWDIEKLENLPESLTHIDISNNMIRKLENLPSNLKHLIIYDNKISEIENIPEGLIELSIGDNKISKIKNLPESLTYLDLYSNKIDKIENLPKSLSYFSIWKNRLSKIENLPQNIKRIDLRDNHISDLLPLSECVTKGKYEIVNDLRQLKNYRIAISGNPITTPPPQIVKRGNHAIVEYFRQLRREQTTLYEAKLLLVGQGEVGKTWLLQRLVTGEKPSDIGTTEGIDVKEWHFTTDEEKDFRVNFWDFGGQEIYHSTHQFFLTKRSLYLFIWDARKDQDRTTSFDYWLNVISLLSQNAPVIVVMNKCDERTKEVEEETLKNRFSNIVGFHKVSALEGTGIAALESNIKQHIQQLPHVGSVLPSVWVEIRKELEGLGADFISGKHYYSICAEHGLNEREAGVLGDYYHDLGVFLHFKESPLLREIVFLNPEWATNAVYKIIDTKEVARNNGRFHYDQLKAIWDEYDEENFKYLIGLMMKFELCFQLGNSAHYIIPELLKPEFTDLPWDNANNTRFEYQYDFMPAGIMSRFITRKHEMIDGELYWRNGVVIAKNSTRALIVSYPLKRNIKIWLKGDEVKELLFLIRDELDKIHETLNYPEVKGLYPCNCSECAGSDKPYFFPSDTLIKFRLKNFDSIQCQQSGEPVNIENLRGAIMSKSDQAFENIIEIIGKNQKKLDDIIQLLEKVSSKMPDEEKPLDVFFDIIKLNTGIIDFGALLKRVLRYKERRFI